jgi:hypothetical protein
LINTIDSINEAPSNLYLGLIKRKAVVNATDSA